MKSKHSAKKKVNNAKENGSNTFFQGNHNENAFFSPSLATKRNKNLPEDLQNKMEKSFGQDFSGVKIHKDSKDAKDLNARAFTQGDNIHFKSGEFDPHSLSGQELIAHELSHVVQQRQGMVQETHKENGFSVNSEISLEKKADVEGQKAIEGKKINKKKPSSKNQNTSVQKKSQPIQLWRDIPGQARIESTAPSTRRAWAVFMRAVRGASGQVPEVELRRRYYNTISQRLRGSFQPINIDIHTTSGYNRHWQGSIRFVFGDYPISISGSGVGQSTLSSASNSSQSLTTSNSETVGSSGGGEVSSSPGSGGGTGGKVTAGGSGSTTSGWSEAQGDSQTASSSSQINQQLNRYRTTIGIEVYISASYDMGSSWTDWVNPFAYSSWAGASLALGSHTAVGSCGTATYYQGSGIRP